ncbi:MAG: FAD binding domain-containing protein [Bdellovibrionota bacterium]
MRNSIIFYLNGVKKEVSGQDIFLPLSSYLRYESFLTGTKVVCAEGDCGACTVMLAKWKPQDRGNNYFSINSCIAMTFAMDGASLVTVEGLAEAEKCAEVQSSMIRNFGGQCGFCTPGFIMSITNLLEQKANQKECATACAYVKLNEQNVKNYLTGNLCRCTGYTPIIKAALDVDIKKHILIKDKYPQVDLSVQMRSSVLISTEAGEYFAPTTLIEACQYKDKYPETILFSGSTDLGVQINKGYLQPKKILSLHLIEELYTQQIEGTAITIGARATLSELQKLVQDRIPSLDRFLNIFASPQIKNSATLVGNLANASPIADMTPVMMALDAEVIIYGKSGKSTKPLKDFYLGYKKLNLQKDEIITHIQFQIPDAQQKFENYKVSQRRDLDISTINASFNFSLNNNKIKTARIALGGVAATTLRLADVENKIIGAEINIQTIESIKKLITDAIHPLTDARGTSEYRTILAANLFDKFAKEQLGL